MTIKISPYKASRILQLFFVGMPQPEIAQRCRVNQSTVSRYAYSFKKEADKLGTTEAAKEYGVMHEVDSLRSLGVELSRNKLTVEETKEGVTILKLFDSLGVPPAEHKTMVRVISRLKNHDFVPAAMKLAELEAITGKSYSEIVSEFEQISSENKSLEQSNITLKQENGAISQSIKELTLAKKRAEQELRELRNKVKQEEMAVRAEIAKKSKETNLTLERMERLEPLALKLKKLGISDDKLEGYLKEHQELEEIGITWENFRTIVRAMKK